MQNNDCCELNLISDYSDFYDDIMGKNSTEVLKNNNCIDKGKCKYIRIREKRQRAEELNNLENLGIATIELGSFSKIIGKCSLDDKVFIYTNPMEHGCKGKRVVSIVDASRDYNNYLMAKYYENDYFVKYLQVGYTAINLLIPTYVDSGGYVKYDYTKIKVLNIENNVSNNLKRIPIFSIDYINVDGKMLAVDFNTVECLEKLNIQSLLSKEKIVSDIYTIISSDYIK